jgi:colanic acid/amylovoran biosynthesis protein
MDIKEILIINQPIGNRGDESAHRALVRSLNQALPSVHITTLTFMDWTNGISEFIVDSPNNEYVRFLFPHNMAAEQIALFLIQHRLTKIGTNLHPILHRLLTYYKRADIILCAPGGICMGGFQNWKHMYLLQLARDLNKPLAYYSRSIGPFPTETALNRKFKSLSEEMLRYFNFISLRDRQSKLIADEMGIQYVSAIDTAFLEQPRCEIPTSIKKNLQEEYVVFVPNQLTWHYAYKEVSPTLIDEFYLEVIDIVNKAFPNNQIVMLPQLCSNPDDSSDYSYFKELKSLAKDSNIFVVPDTYSSDIQQTIISNSNCVIGSRYHTIVFSINNEVPFVALNYEHKIAGLLEELNLTSNMVDITKTFKDTPSVKQTLENFYTTLEHVRNNPPRRDYANNLAKECFNNFLQSINSTNQ